MKLWTTSTSNARTAGGYDPRSGKRSFIGVMRDWLDERKGIVSPATYDTDRYIIEWIPERFRALPVGEIRPATVDAMLNELARAGRAQSSIERARRTWSEFFAWAARQGMIPASPMHAARIKAQLNWPETAGGRSIHRARHTAICLWLAAGISVEKVQAWAGHASIVTTNRYVTYLGQDDEDEIAKVVG